MSQKASQYVGGTGVDNRNRFAVDGNTSAVVIGAAAVPQAANAWIQGTAVVTSNLVVGTDISVGNGSNTAPSINFNSDKDTGIYLSSQNVISFTGKGLERMNVHGQDSVVFFRSPAIFRGDDPGYGISDDVAWVGDYEGTITKLRQTDGIGLAAGNFPLLMVNTQGIISNTTHRIALTKSLSWYNASGGYIGFISSDGILMYAETSIGGNASFSFSGANTYFYRDTFFDGNKFHIFGTNTWIAPSTLTFATTPIPSGNLNIDIGDSGSGGRLFRTIYVGNVAVADGSAVNPSIKFNGDLNTGLYRAETDNIAITTGGTLRVSVNALGIESTVNMKATGFNQLTTGNWMAPAENIQSRRNNVNSAIVTADAILLRRSDKVSRYFTSLSETIDVNAAGANGIDTGVRASNTWYHIYAIGKEDNTLDAILSTNVSVPILPANYTYYGFIGAIFSQQDNTFQPMRQRGNRVIVDNRQIHGATYFGGPTIIDMANYIPIPATAIYTRLDAFSGSGVTHSGTVAIFPEAAFSPSGSFTYGPSPMTTNVSTVAAYLPITTPQSIAYFTQVSGNLKVWIEGWEY